MKNEKALPNFSNVIINGIGIYVRRPDVVIGKKGRDLYHIENTKNIEQCQSALIRIGENMGNGKQK